MGLLPSIFASYRKQAVFITKDLFTSAFEQLKRDKMHEFREFKKTADPNLKNVLNAGFQYIYMHKLFIITLGEAIKYFTTDKNLIMRRGDKEALDGVGVLLQGDHTAFVIHEKLIEYINGIKSGFFNRGLVHPVFVNILNLPVFQVAAIMRSERDYIKVLLVRNEWLERDNSKLWRANNQLEATLENNKEQIANMQKKISFLETEIARDRVKKWEQYDSDAASNYASSECDPVSAVQSDDELTADKTDQIGKINPLKLKCKPIKAHDYDEKEQTCSLSPYT